MIPSREPLDMLLVIQESRPPSVRRAFHEGVTSARRLLEVAGRRRELDDDAGELVLDLLRYIRLLPRRGVVAVGEGCQLPLLGL